MEFFKQINASTSQYAPCFSWLDTNGLNTWTWSSLETLTGRIAMYLRSVGVKKGDRVVLVFMPGLEFIGAFFGCIRSGIIAVPVSAPSLSVQKEATLFQLLVQDCQAKFILGSKRYFQAVNLQNSLGNENTFLHVEDAYSFPYEKTTEFFDVIFTARVY